MKVIDLFDSLISHNEVIALWVDIGRACKECTWRGMAHELPDEYKNKSVVRIFGTIPPSITEADTINILYAESKDGTIHGAFSYSGTRARNANKRYYGGKFADALLAGKFPMPIFDSESDIETKSPIGFVTMVKYQVDMDLCTCEFILNNFFPLSFSIDQFQRNLYICPALHGTTEYDRATDCYNVTGEVELKYFYLTATPASFTYRWEEVKEIEKE